MSRQNGRACLYVAVDLLQGGPEELYGAFAAGVQALLQPLRQAHDLRRLQAGHLKGPKEPECPALLHSACTLCADLNRAFAT